jgi:hypothetical protein
MHNIQQIHDHMEVFGADGVHVGMVDHIATDSSAPGACPPFLVLDLLSYRLLVPSHG